MLGLLGIPFVKYLMKTQTQTTWQPERWSQTATAWMTFVKRGQAASRFHIMSAAAAVLADQNSSLVFFVLPLRMFGGDCLFLQILYY